MTLSGIAVAIFPIFLAIFVVFHLPSIDFRKKVFFRGVPVAWLLVVGLEYQKRG